MSRNCGKIIWKCFAEVRNRTFRFTILRGLWVYYFFDCSSRRANQNISRFAVMVDVNTAMHAERQFGLLTNDGCRDHEHREKRKTGFHWPTRDHSKINVHRSEMIQQTQRKCTRFCARQEPMPMIFDSKIDANDYAQWWWRRGNDKSDAISRRRTNERKMF